MAPYRIVIADDHALIRENVRNIIDREKEFQVVGEAADGDEVLDLLSVGAKPADLVILDISMPRMSGIDAARRIKAIFPGMKVLFLTVHQDPEYLDSAVSAGAAGYLLKEDAVEQLFPAVKAIQSGGCYFSPRIHESPGSSFKEGGEKGRNKVPAERI